MKDFDCPVCGRSACVSRITFVCSRCNVGIPHGQRSAVRAGPPGYRRPARIGGANPRWQDGYYLEGLR